LSSPSAAGAASSAAPPPSHWLEYSDPKKPRKYYYNVSTKKTVWRDPRREDPQAVVLAVDPVTKATRPAEPYVPRTGGASAPPSPAFAPSSTSLGPVPASPSRLASLPALAAPTTPVLLPARADSESPPSATATLHTRAPTALTAVTPKSALGDSAAAATPTGGRVVRVLALDPSVAPVAEEPDASVASSSSVTTGATISDVEAIHLRDGVAQFEYKQ